MIRWRSDGFAGAAPDVCVFVDTTRETLFDGTPIRADGALRQVTASGLDPDVEHFIGLALADGTGAERRSGPVLRVVTGEPIYCDAASGSASPDGDTPATAYANLQVAVIQAFLAGGGNIWIASGVYPDLAINLPAGVHLYGGFPPGFVGARDSVAWPTRLTGRAGASILNLVPGDATAVLEGLILDGVGVALNGLNIDGAEAEIRELVLRRCGRGAKLRGPVDQVLREKFVACAVLDNGGEGLSLDGAFDLLAEACDFRGNLREGLDAGKLIAPDAEQAGVTLLDCRFAHNGEQGLEIDLDAPAAGGATGGTFEITVEDCAFEANADSGFLIDLDFEQHPLWRAEVFVRGCEARANGSHGGSLDLDAAASVLVHRLASTGNRGAGLRVTSETRAGTITVSSSALAGNLGPGAWLSTGNFGGLFAHCVVAGNGGGGLVSSFVESLVHSTVFHMQPSPVSGFVSWASVESSDPLQPPFRHAPRQYASVQDIDGTELRLAVAADVALGQVAEVLDDRVARQVTGVSATGFAIEPAVNGLLVPFPVALFGAQSTDVLEDYQLSPASSALGMGMAVPFGPAVDAGIFGAPWTGPPGREDLLPADPFLVVDRSPAWGSMMAPGQDFEMTLAHGLPDPATLGNALFAVEPGGASAAISFEVSGERIVVHAPPGGWTPGTTVQLHSALRSTAGDALAVPAAFRLRLASGG